MDCVGLDQKLEAGESVVWTGKPGSQLFLSNRQGWTIAGWALLLLFGLGLAPALWHPPFAVWDYIAIAVLLWLALDSWRLGRWLLRRRGEAYAVTSRRIFVLERDGSVRSETSLLRAHEFRRVPGPAYLDSLVLGQDQPLFTGRNVDSRPASDAPRLSAIAGGDSLLALIHKTAAAREIEWARSGDGT